MGQNSRTFAMQLAGRAIARHLEARNDRAFYLTSTERNDHATPINNKRKEFSQAVQKKQ